MTYFETVKPTYIENWPAALHGLSIVSKDIPLTILEANILGSTITEWGETFGYPYKRALRMIEPVRERVRNVLENFPGECGFIRLGSRSPKDSWLGHKHGFKVKANDENQLRFIQDCSERMYEDLTLAIRENYPPTLFVRQWIDLAKWQEWRCFMRGRKLVGISQGNYLDGRIAECVEHKDSVRWAIEQFFPRFREACHLDDVVFDVFVMRKEYVPADKIKTVTWEVKLLEINPFFEFTDPCLFSWQKGGDFDGSIRVKATVKPESTQTSAELRKGE